MAAFWSCRRSHRRSGGDISISITLALALALALADGGRRSAPTKEWCRFCVPDFFGSKMWYEEALTRFDYGSVEAWFESEIRVGPIVAGRFGSVLVVEEAGDALRRARRPLEIIVFFIFVVVDMIGQCDQIFGHDDRSLGLLGVLCRFDNATNATRGGNGLAFVSVLG